MSDLNLFTYQMRKATRSIHAVSDALVNAKLAMALNSDKVWAEGLLVFYEIFKFLEEAMKEKKNENIGKLFIKGMDRTRAFEQDLSHYYGVNWKKTYVIRDSVAKYLSRLKYLLNNESDLLIAYIYHLYMGLLSGGQILRKKRELKQKMLLGATVKSGEAVTDFGDIRITDLKNDLKSLINEIGETFDDKKRLRIIEEGKKVFELNNMILRSIECTDKVLFGKACYLVFVLTLVVILYRFILPFWSSASI